MTLGDELRSAILEALGEMSAIFMSKQERGIDIVMPTEDLLAIAEKTVEKILAIYICKR